MKQSLIRFFVIILIGLSPTNSSIAVAQPNVNFPVSISLTLIESGLSKPVHVTHAGDGSGRLFVVEQDGRIQILRNGNVLASPFLNINGRVKSPADDPNNGEEGLLSVAFPPGFGSGKNHFYVYYTNLDGNNQVSRFSVSQDPDIASSGSEELILLFLHPDQTNHNGGQIVFGPDGYLYIGTGDGGGGGDPNDNAQNPASLLGKMLRIDVEQDAPGDTTNHNFLYLPLFRGARGTSPATYSIPSDNPYADQFGYRGELWALGMRNPWRFSFDRLTHDLYIGDVGQGNWEEVDFQPAISQGGENYGWDNMEGLACYEPMSGCITAGMTLPIQVYANEAGCYAVTGGYVYRGANYPSMQGTYFYADYCIGKIWGLQPNGASWDNQEFLDTTHNISSFGEDQAGELYLTTLGGSVYQIVTP